ncbi:MAG: hypothetical protein JPMHGGIA_01941 [Saprospiraceae bacterium]|jgi:hypothetical protein|nr:hypothetical protein [Saprospiraceae bacterium]
MHAYARMVCLLCCTLASYGVSSQGSLTASAGMSLMYTNNPKTNPSDDAMSGYLVGLSGRMYKNRFYLQPGVELHVVKLFAQNSLDPFSNLPSAYLVKIPMILGFDLLRSEVFALRAFTGGQLSFTAGVDKTKRGLTRKDVKDAQFGLLFGGGVDFGILNFDVRFEKGLMDFYVQKGYKADFVIFSAGLRF